MKPHPFSFVQKEATCSAAAFMSAGV
jgi:Enoyl-(Acyl carrier protein) reductase